jgi:hypothetical protein
MTEEITVPQPQQPAPSAIRKIFLGPQGIRAGWSVLLAIAIFFALAALTNGIVHHFRHPHPPANLSAPLPAHKMLLAEGISVLFISLVTFIMSRIEKKSFCAYGLAGAHRLSYFLKGVFWGFLHISLLIAALLLTHHITIAYASLSFLAAIRYGLVWFIGFVLVGIFEEMTFRGYLQWTLARGIGFWWAAALLSFGFGFTHHTNPGESPIGLVLAGLVAFIFCLSIWYTRSLWWAIGFHAAWDWGQNFVYGTADSGMRTQGTLFLSHPNGRLLWSGGSTGPEGSLFCLPILLLMALVIYLTLRNASPQQG